LTLGVAYSLAYSIKSVVEKEAVLTYKGETELIDFGTIEVLIVSEFWYEMNRRGWVGKETEELIAYTLDKLAFYRSPESGRTKTSETDMQTDPNNPFNKWRGSPVSE